MQTEGVDQGQPPAPELPAAQTTAELLATIAAPRGDALLVIGADGTICFANQAAGTLFGRSAEKLIGTVFGHPLGGREPLDIEILQPDGTVVIAEMHLDLIQWQQAPAYLAVLHDITARKRNEQLLIESQQLLRSTLDALPAQIVILDRAGTILAVNDAWQEFARGAGAAPQRSGVGHSYLAICEATYGPAVAQLIIAGIRDVAGDHRSRFYLEYAFARAGGPTWLALTVTRFGRGDRLRLVVVHDNISERKQIEQLDNDRRQVLERVARNEPLSMVSEELLTMAAHHYPEAPCIGIALHSGSTYIRCAQTDAEAAGASLGAWALDQIMLHSAAANLPVIAQTPRDPDDIDLLYAPAVQLGVAHCWLAPLRANTSITLGVVLIGLRAQAYPSPDDLRFIEMLLQLTMIAIEQHERTRQLAYRAYHDDLTGLPNRLLFEDRLHRAIEAARRSQLMVAVLFIDLDRFKEINDTLGHSTGDTLLMQVARRMERCIRVADTLARRGGDEFMVVLPDIVNTEPVLKVAQRIQDLLRLPFVIDQHELLITASIGASLFPADGADAETLQRHADTAMYRAKQTLRSSFQFFDSLITRSTMERFQLEVDLRRALERNELEIYYQPKVNREGGLRGAEALLRWRHPLLGMVIPSDFIPLAEETGLIIPIGAWVLREVCRQLRAWDADGLPRLPIAINVSALQFSQPDFLSSIEQALARAGLDPARIELELTETMLMGNSQTVTAQLTSLRALGLTLAIDDFGRGYSSLGYLQHLPISVLKIDRSFIRGITEPANQAGAQAIITAIVTLGHHLGMQVVAEGVETPAQHALLGQIGCDQLQGFLFCRPVLATTFADLLRNPTVRLGGALPEGASRA